MDILAEMASITTGGRVDENKASLKHIVSLYNRSQF
jgi:hypothetical protein